MKVGKEKSRADKLKLQETVALCEQPKHPFRCCGNCQFFEYYDQTCRNRPPVPRAKAALTNWPTVSPALGWCRQFSPRPELLLSAAGEQRLVIKGGTKFWFWVDPLKGAELVVATDPKRARLANNKSIGFQAFVCSDQLAFTRCFDRTVLCNSDDLPDLTDGLRDYFVVRQDEITIREIFNDTAELVIYRALERP